MDMNLANKLTMLRVVMIPVFLLVLFLAPEPMNRYVAVIIFIVASLTDMLDGKIARKFNMISTIGKFLDPLADKCTQFTLIVCLAIKYPVQNPMLWVLAGLMFVKEIFQLVAGIIQFRKGKMLTGALLSGKICTAVLFVSLILMVLMPRMSATVVTVIIVVDAIFMLISFAHYALTSYKKTPMIQNIEDHEDRKR